ncbi:PhzF family phenazine biosynthesis protein [Rhodobacteraceae bacterium RKSG542]|uniref:PhzF family phenazine biosynthesis protein n=1 Tax=Pseudovibrio flavus TaxID=2529854 RepID=UPI0012BCDBF7|nr:PhzF family phenazine biosynthesis protein [Pseudovibrio flavus]MTI19189.1 PhzF family phenazine biosynthesis protein [Pseudovibrio flavus]
MPRRYVILDVFTQNALEGNPLAVVLDAQDLSDEQMQRLAQEFNLSETVFVLPPENPAHSAALRIFTPGEELGFAGHPTVGTAVLLAQERFKHSELQQNAVVVLEEKLGTIRCGVKLEKPLQGFAEFDVPQVARPALPVADNEMLAAALGISPLELTFENHRPLSMDAGKPFAFIPLRDLSVMEQIRPNSSLWKKTFTDYGFNNIFLYCRECVCASSDFHARMLYEDRGSIREDAATGSAVAAFAGIVAYYDKPLDGSHIYKIEQGYEMERPSKITLELEMDKGKIRRERIGGNAVVIGRGELYV